jgi:hypothetical protein
VATEVVKPVAPPQSSGTDNLGGGERAATEAVTSRAATEPLVEATSGGGDIVAASTEQTVPLSPPTRGHEIEASVAEETPVLTRLLPSCSRPAKQ